MHIASRSEFLSFCPWPGRREARTAGYYRFGASTRRFGIIPQTALLQLLRRERNRSTRPHSVILLHACVFSRVDDHILEHLMIS